MVGRRTLWKKNWLHLYLQPKWVVLEIIMVAGEKMIIFHTFEFFFTKTSINFSKSRDEGKRSLFKSQLFPFLFFQGVFLTNVKVCTFCKVEQKWIKFSQTTGIVVYATVKQGKRLSSKKMGSLCRALPTFTKLKNSLGATNFSL